MIPNQSKLIIKKLLLITLLIWETKTNFLDFNAVKEIGKNEKTFRIYTKEGIRFQGKPGSKYKVKIEENQILKGKDDEDKLEFEYNVQIQWFPREKIFLYCNNGIGLEKKNLIVRNHQKMKMMMI